MAPALPPTVRPIVRGWLNSNIVVLRAPGDNVVIDSGYCSHREETLHLLAGPAGLEGEPVERLVNTHCHSDHMGGNAAIASTYGCRITIPEGEVKHVVPWTPQSVWMARFDQRADPFHFDDTIAAGDAFDGGGFTWEAHAAPGHDMDALVYFEPANRILVSGDALWENGMGFVWPDEGANAGIAAARAALDAIDRLHPALVIPGHGSPFADVAGALGRARAKLDAFAADPRRNARHAMKVLFTFALLDKRSMPVAQVERYLAGVPCYRELSDRFLGLDAPALAGWMLADLEKSGAVAIRDGVVRPTMSA
ncbi:MAG TPA: MBL fold metallo-hydrolase [Usitatibacter sp.]|nr:MBL fold metallo-hydrolase [Usitatibacter sp.]